MGISKDPMHSGRWLKPRKPIDIAQLSCRWHRVIVTTFPGEEKYILLGFYHAQEAFEG